jgi:hypothetical protein
MSLHLRYRLWIAEMNLDINVLRILGDYLEELATKKDQPGVKTGIDYFEEQFIKQRKEIDELKDEMHLLKMKLASYSRESKLVDYKTYQADNHTDLKKRYFAFRKTFDKIKNEFIDFEGKLLQ